jgi:hypothetical protein
MFSIKRKSFHTLDEKNRLSMKIFIKINLKKMLKFTHLKISALIIIKSMSIDVQHRGVFVLKFLPFLMFKYNLVYGNGKPQKD